MQLSMGALIHQVHVCRATFDVFQHTVDDRHYVSFQLESLVGSGLVATSTSSRSRILGHGWCACSCMAAITGPCSMGPCGVGHHNVSA